MPNWLHHLFQPHCEQCQYELHYLQEKLSLLLEQERAEKFRLLQLIAPDHNISARSDDSIDVSTLRRNPRTIMRDLERNSAIEADAIRKRRESEKIEELESELANG